MRFAGLPLTILIVGVSLVISFVLFELGIYFFFLPIVFLPFVRFFKRNAKASHTCPVCGMHSDGNYCPRCGTKIL